MGSAPESSGARKNLRLAIIVAVVVAALFYGGRALGWWGDSADGALRLYGNVEIREVQLGFRVGGRIERLLVDEGDTVQVGQVLAQLDTRPLGDKLASADARYQSASASAARDANGSRDSTIWRSKKFSTSSEKTTVRNGEFTCTLDFHIAVQPDQYLTQLIATNSMKSGLWHIKADWNSGDKGYYQQESIVVN